MKASLKTTWCLWTLMFQLFIQENRSLLVDVLRMELFSLHLTVCVFAWVYLLSIYQNVAFLLQDLVYKCLWRNPQLWPWHGGLSWWFADSGILHMHLTGNKPQFTHLLASSFAFNFIWKEWLQALNQTHRGNIFVWHKG